MEIITVEQAAQLLLNALLAIIAGGFGAAPITLFLVSLIKRIPQLADTPASGVQFVVGLLLTVAFWIAQALGVQMQFENIMEVIVVVGPAILGLLTTLSGSALYYQIAQRTDASVLGYQRTTPAQEHLAARDIYGAQG